MMDREEIEIVDYQQTNQPDFDRLNRQWIEKYFKLEPIDAWVLENPEEAIIRPGGVILLAKMNGRIVGAVALKKRSEKTYEFTKMAVAEEIRNRGIGEKLGRAAIEKAKKLGASRIVLYSNTVLENAIRLYYRIGFQMADPEAGGYERCNIKMEYPILPINIKQASPDDARLISDIGKISFCHTFESVFKNKEEMQHYIEVTYSLDKIKSGLQKSNNIFLLGYADGAPVGFAKIKCNSPNSQLNGASQIQLQKLYVLPRFLGLGIGLHLLKAAKQIALSKQADCLWLDVIIENHKAIGFYEKNGFVKQAKHEFKIGNQLFTYHVMMHATVSREQ